MSSPEDKLKKVQEDINWALDGYTEEELYKIAFIADRAQRQLYPLDVQRARQLISYMNAISQKFPSATSEETAKDEPK